MKKTRLFLPFAFCLLPFFLNACTLPWQKNTETETVVVDSSNPELGTTTQPAPTADITPSDTPKAIAEGGIYLPYTSTAVAQAKWQIVLFFYANWSPSSLEAHKDIEKNIKNIPADLTILQTNYDDEKQLRELYGITEQHSFVQVDNTGKMIKKWRGGTTLAELVGQVQK
jgi:thioredoxin 1